MHVIFAQNIKNERKRAEGKLGLSPGLLLGLKNFKGLRNLTVMFSILGSVLYILGRQNSGQIFFF